MTTHRNFLKRRLSHADLIWQKKEIAKKLDLAGVERLVIDVVMDSLGCEHLTDRALGLKKAA
jgi:hypothetical protein